MSSIDFAAFQTSFLALDGSQADLDRCIADLERRKPGRFPVRFTVEVGTHKTVDELVQTLEAQGDKLGSWASRILPQVTISKRQTLKIVTPSVRELGFTAAETPIPEIHRKGKELGYALCPSDLALSLRLQYRDQPMREVISVAMEALKHSLGHLHLFRVARAADGRYVNTLGSHPENTFRLDSRFAFVDPQA